MPFRADDDGVLRHDQLLHAACQPEHGDRGDGQRDLPARDREIRVRQLHRLARRRLLSAGREQDEKRNHCTYRPFLGDRL